MGQILVQKYGGSSLADCDQLARVAAHIKSCLQDFSRLVVVVSAMGSYTDELLGLALQLNECPPKRELDMLVTSGERISMSLLGIALDKLGIKAISLTGSQSGILTDHVHGNARISHIRGLRIQDSLLAYQVVIVAGFQGVNPKTKEITSLGRGGSDLTAIALAIELKATTCAIYTDVAGVYTSDPRRVVGAKLIEKLSWNVMRDMAWAGSCVLHHRAAYLASKFKLDLRLRSSRQFEHQGTLICGNRSKSPLLVKGINMESALVEAISQKNEQCLLRFAFSSEKVASLALVYINTSLWKNDESPQILQQSMESSNTTSVTVVLSQHCIKRLLEEMAEHPGFKLTEITPVQQRLGLATISLIGQGFRQNPEIVARAFASLGVVPEFVNISDSILCFVISSGDIDSVLPKVHHEFFKDP